MKISKLFHWLYAFLMALPIFAVLSACLISTFNMQSKQESEISYKFETNEVNSVNDLIPGRIYHYVRDYSLASDGNSMLCTGVYISRNNYLVEDTLNTGLFAGNFNRTYGRMRWQLSGLDVTTLDYYFNSGSWVLDVYVIFNVISFTDDYTYYSKSDFNVIKGVETNNVETQDIFYNAIDNVKQSPLFSWAYDSFLVAPFSYIVSLFSMPANSFVVQMLSYWLAISIIWLVFDLVMYVPLLVHRWLDKGVLE